MDKLRFKLTNAEKRCLQQVRENATVSEEEHCLKTKVETLNKYLDRAKVNKDVR